MKIQKSLIKTTTILLYSFLLCDIANAQKNTLPDALFSKDGKYALISSKSNEWHLFSNNDNKIREAFIMQNDSFVAYDYDTTDNKSPYRKENILAIYDESRMKSYLDGYKLHIAPLDVTGQLRVTVDTLKIGREKLSYYSDSVSVHKYIFLFSFYYQNKLLDRDTIVANSEAGGIDGAYPDDSTYVYYDNKSVGYSFNTKLYFDSVSNFYWLCSGIFVSNLFSNPNIDINKNGETSINIIESQGVQNHIQFGKLH